MFKVKIRKCEAFRASVNFLGTNGIFQKKLLFLKSLHYCTVLLRTPKIFETIDASGIVPIYLKLQKETLSRKRCLISRSMVFKNLVKNLDWTEDENLRLTRRQNLLYKRNQWEKTVRETKTALELSTGHQGTLQHLALKLLQRPTPTAIKSKKKCTVQPTLNFSCDLDLWLLII